MPPRLLALDLDGTLLRPGGGIDPRDAAAVQRALDEGVIVTIATGRMGTGALPTARALGLDTTLVCADGALLVCGRTGARLEQRAVALPVAESTLGTLDHHALAPFFLLHDRIHCDARGACHREYVQIWTDAVHVHDRLADEDAWRCEGEIAIALGIGAREAVEAAKERLEREHAESLDLLTFRVHRSETDWAVMARPRGVTKGEALARVAAQMEVAREDAAAVGDWYNDVSMLEWAGRSFAMGQAPERVRAAATDTLQATSESGGGVAEAITRWLGDAR